MWVLPSALGAFTHKQCHLDKVLAHELAELLGHQLTWYILLPTQLMKQVGGAVLSDGSITITL